MGLKQVLSSPPRFPWLLAVCFLGSGLLHGAPKTSGFEANIKKSGPDGSLVEGRLFASGPQLRVEAITPTGPQISLLNRDTLKQVGMDPGSRTYSETQILEDFKPLFGVIRCNHELPCLTPSASDCVDLGDTMLNGRLAKRWLKTRGPGGYRQQWVDVERGWVLRSHAPGLKMLMSLRFAGLETLEGRLVEKWERRQDIAFRPPEVSWFWYDPALELVVREEWMGGYVQAISNIRPGVQPGWLFQVPAEYRRLGPGVSAQPRADEPAQSRIDGQAPSRIDGQAQHSEMTP